MIIILILVILIFWIYVFIRNIFLEETEGKIDHVGYRKEIRFHGRSSSLHNVETTFYSYEVNEKHYLKWKISNVALYPNVLEGKQVGDTITVYYSRFFNGYSLLFKCDLKYFFANSVPLFIIIIIAIKYKQKYLRKIKTIDLLKYYFRNDTGIYKKYNIK